MPLQPARLLHLMGLALLLACGRAREETGLDGSHRATRPNLVLVTLDTVRVDRLAAQGRGPVATPALDRIARRGVRFANAATTVPFTLPAHCSILTGVYPPRHGVRENVGHALAPDLPTLAERLHDAGYATAGFVSAFVLDRRWGLARGFDAYRDDFDLGAIEQGNLASVQRDGADTVAAATAWLDERPADAPFFLWLHLYDAHDPYTPPEPFASRYAGRPYDGELAYVDTLVGRFLEALSARRLLDATALVVTSDHGEALGDHGELHHGFFLYEATAHVLLLLRLPDGALAGRTVETAVSHVDLVPTFLELAGLPVATGLDGQSLLALAGSPYDPSREVYSESLYPLLHYGWAPLRALRSARRKYVEAPLPELYDLATDPGELRNLLASDRREADAPRHRLAALRARLEAALNGTVSPTDLDEETLGRLAALGYLAGRGGIAPRDEATAPRADPKERIALHRALMAAQGALGAGELEAARSELEAIVRRDSTLIEAHQLLGRLAALERRWDDAIACYQRALALDATDEASLFGLASAYRALGRAAEALAGFERLSTLAPHDSKAALAAADLQVAAGQRRRAIALLESNLTRPGDSPLVAARLGELLVEEGRGTEARALFELALEADPRFAQPYFDLGVLAEESGQIDLAMRRYEEAIARAPNHFRARFNLGRLYGVQGDRRRQEALWRSALEANPDFVRGYYLLAKLLMDAGGDLAEAEALARAGLARDHEHVAGPLGYYLLADLLSRDGRAQEALAAERSGRALEAAPAPDRTAAGPP